FLGFRLGFGLALALRFGLQVGLLLRRLLAGGLEVRRVPAASFELEAGGAQLLLIGLLPARRAFRERLLRDLLQVLFLVPARLAAVFVDRHAAIISLFRKEYRLPCRRTCRPASSPPPPVWPRLRPSVRRDPASRAVRRRLRAGRASASCRRGCRC